jgi:hypothetical protein
MIAVEPVKIANVTPAKMTDSTTKTGANNRKRGRRVSAIMLFLSLTASTKRGTLLRNCGSLSGIRKRDHATVADESQECCIFMTKKRSLTRSTTAQATFAGRQR